METLSNRDAATLLFDWTIWAREKQLPPPGDWRVWLILAGRGFGKTRTGAEWVRAEIEEGRCGRIALVGETAADARDVMVEGDSGILKISPPWNRPKYEPSKRRLTWPNGAIATTFSAEDPEQLRGPQFDGAWCDEIAKWRYRETWDNLVLGLRLGHHPRVVATSTPRPRAWLLELMADPGVAVTQGGTLENVSNLSKSFVDSVVRTYGGTRLGRQELDGEMLTDVPGALWSRDMVEAARRKTFAASPTRVVIAVDPAVTSGADADETGIVAAGALADGTFAVLEDASGRLSPDAWARKAVALYHVRKADAIVAEANQGGDLVREVLRMVDPAANVRLVHASRGKRVRAEPIAALYEQGRVIHARPLPALEDQLCGYTGGDGEASPDRLDALVWALTDLASGSSREFLI